MDHQIEEWCCYNFAAGSIDTADFFLPKLYFTGKNSNIWFCAILWGLRSNVHSLSMARLKARGRLPISANWTCFRQLSRLRRYERILVEIVVFDKGWVTLSGNFWKRSCPPTTVGVRKLAIVRWLSWCCFRDPTFSRCDTIPACDRQTHRHDDG